MCLFTYLFHIAKFLRREIFWFKCSTHADVVGVLFAIFVMFAHKMSFDDLDNLFRKIIDTEQQVQGRLARVSEGNTQLV